LAVWAPNLPEWVILESAAGLAGLVLVTVNPALRPAELAYVLNQSGAARHHPGPGVPQARPSQPRMGPDRATAITGRAGLSRSQRADDADPKIIVSANGGMDLPLT